MNAVFQSNQEPSAPADFVEITREEFFSTVGHLDVHPRAERMMSAWEERGSREVVGITTPGYMEQGRNAYYAKRNRFAGGAA
jgi:hypothetical protein